MFESVDRQRQTDGRSPLFWVERIIFRELFVNYPSKLPLRIAQWLEHFPVMYMVLSSSLSGGVFICLIIFIEASYDRLTFTLFCTRQKVSVIARETVVH